MAVLAAGQVCDAAEREGGDALLSDETRGQRGDVVTLPLVVNLDGHVVRMSYSRPYDNCQMTLVR